MIGTLIRNSWTSLRRDRAAQVLAFVVPIAFFSIFAVVFGGGGGDRMSSPGRVTVLVVDESRTAESRAFLAALRADSSLRVLERWTARDAEATGESGDVDRARAEELVKRGAVPVALVLPAGIEAALRAFGGGTARAELLHDPSDPVSGRVVGGLMQRAALRVLSGGALTPGGPEDNALLPLRYETRAVLGVKRDQPMVAFYAAGIAVMFIMFSAAGGGGVLIEETESGTLERVLTTGAGMSQLLLGKWLYLTSLGVLQILVMFVWGMLVFRLPLLEHLPGFAIMTVFTAAAAAAFGLVLATLARTRQQLAGLANLLVLSLNAVGGSMFPRFLMSETLQKFSLVAFNAWALDGFLKVFWREQSLVSLAPQVAALTGFTLLFLLLARRLARRWETA